MKKLIIFLLDLLSPLAIALLVSSVEPCYNGNGTIQGIPDYIHENFVVFFCDSDV